MRATASMLVCLGMLTAVLFVVPDGVLAEAEVQILNPDAIYQCDMDVQSAEDYGIREVLSNHTWTDNNLFDYSPGFVNLVATSKWVGEFNTATIKLRLADPSGVTADYYNLRVYTAFGCFDEYPTINPGGWDWQYSPLKNHIRFGVGTTGADTPAVESVWPTAADGYAEGEYLYPRCTYGSGSWQYSGVLDEYNRMNYTVGHEIGGLTKQGHYHDFNLNPLYDRPWTLNEVQNMYVVMYYGWTSGIFDFTAYYTAQASLSLAQLYAVAIPTTYEETTYTGGFILRPDGDLGSERITNESDASSPLYAAVDETTHYSDLNVTYLKTGGPIVNWAEFSFSDPPSWASSTTEYTIYPWMILQVDGVLTEDYTLLQWYAHASYATDWDTWEIVPETVLEFFTNKTQVAYNLTLADLYSMIGGFNFDELGPLQVNVTQFAILCVPGAYVPVVGDEDTDGGIFGWVMSGGGILGIFGMLGFFGMVATMVISAYSFREGGGYESLTGGFMLFMVFLALFLAAVFAAG